MTSDVQAAVFVWQLNILQRDLIVQVAHLVRTAERKIFFLNQPRTYEYVLDILAITVKCKRHLIVKIRNQ